VREPLAFAAVPTCSPSMDGNRVPWQLVLTRSRAFLDWRSSGPFRKPEVVRWRALALGPALAVAAWSAIGCGSAGGRGNAQVGSEPAAGDVAGWLVVLREPDVYAQRRAGGALARIGPAAVPGLREALADQRVEVRDQALIALIAIGPDGLPGIGDGLLDRDPL